jgi:YVTN family beta-propeller protein
MNSEGQGMHRWKLVLTAGMALALLALLPGAPPAIADPVPIGTISVGDGPLAVAVNPATNLIYVANYLSDDVSVIEGETSTALPDTISVGERPRSVAVNSITNRIYVPSSFSSDVSVIDGQDNSVLTVPVGGSPGSVAVNPATNHVYLGIGAGVAVMDGTTHSVLDTIPLSDGPWSLAVNPATNRIYALDAPDNRLSVIDGATHDVLATTSFLCSQPSALAVNHRTNRIYVTCYLSGGVKVIDGSTNTVIATIGGGYPIPQIPEPSAVAVDHQTNRIYVTSLSYDRVFVIDGETNTLLPDYIDVGDWPRGVAVNPQTDRIYVANYNSDSVSVIEDAPSSPVWVTAIEVTQAIQDLYNSVPLVEGKPTFVRVYVRSGGDPVAVEGELYGWDALGQPLDGSPLPPDNAEAVTAEAQGSEHRRSRLWDSLLYELPPSWRQGDITLQVQLTVDSEVVAESWRHWASFQPRGPLNVALVPVIYQPNGTTVEPEDGWKTRFMSWLPRVYPLRFEDVELSIGGPVYIPSGWGEEGLLIKLWWHHHNTTNPVAPLHYYGVLNYLVPSDGRGRARVGGLEAWGLDFPFEELTSKLAAEEIAHNLGRRHAPCSEHSDPLPDKLDPEWPPDHPIGEIGDGTFFGAWGFDTKSRTVLSPYRYRDFMGYCSDEWVSDYTYKKLFEVLAPTGTTVAQGSSEGQLRAADHHVSASSGYLLVSGFASPSAQEATFDPIFWTETPADITGSQPGPYALELQDSYGAVLVSHTFDITVTAFGAQAEMEEPLPFGEVLPFDTDAETLVLSYEGEVLASKQFAGNPPQVTVTYPNGGESLAGTVTLTWQATDPDGDSLTYLVLYSQDGGATWQSVAVGLESTTFELDTTLIGGGSQGIMKVQASDGMLTGEDTSDAFFTVATKVPSIYVVEPTVPGPFASGDAVTLAGFGFDPEDGPIPADSLSWQSDIDGALGTGGEIVTTSLSVGLHTVTLTGQDTDENSGTAQTSLEVVAEPVDSDSDALTDVRELMIGTDRYDPDSDVDQLSDGAEVDVWGTDPLNTDTDGDGFTDGDEVNIYGTDPLDPDSHPDPPVGGIAEYPDVAGTDGDSGWSAGLYATVAALAAVVVLALTAGAWCARRLWPR